jgi:hypothetical protein
MLIPKRFKLLGHTIEVMDENDRYYEKGSFGACSYESKWIKLVQPSEHHPITQGSLEHTFCHELTHMLLYHSDCAAGKNLRDDEGFVDLLAGLLHQALTTMEYE